MTPSLNPALAAATLLSLGAVLAGCSPTDSSAEPTGRTGDKYEDGTYTETGEYNPPSGDESIEVTVTLERDIITELRLVGSATCCTQGIMQSRFAQGAKDLVIGVNIDDLDVHRVGGSSLTSEGFNIAIEEIKADAAR